MGIHMYAQTAARLDHDCESAVLPLLIICCEDRGGSDPLDSAPGLCDLAGFLRTTGGTEQWPLLAACVVACIAAVAPVGKRLLARDRVGRAGDASFLLWLLFPVALTRVAVVARPVFLGRYMIFACPHC